MAMGIGINDSRPDEGRLRGHQEAVACYVWFTSEGEVMPKRMKYKDPEGNIQEVRNIRVLSHKQNNYCGIPAIRYECSCCLFGREWEFSLIYYLERHEWKLLWKI